MTYLMSPNLFNQLTSVSGFVERNGNNYGEHILNVFFERASKREEESVNEKECADEIKKLCQDVLKDDFFCSNKILEWPWPSVRVQAQVLS